MMDGIIAGSSETPAPRRFGVREHRRMARLGILRPEERTALVGGVIIDRATARPRLFDVDDYHRMAELGILRPDERVELIEGIITEMNAIGAPHLRSVMALNHAFTDASHKRYLVSVRNSVRLGRGLEPQPDVALLWPRADDYWRAPPPGPADIFLLVEVADTTLKTDLGIKARLYARAGITDYWVVDLNGRMVWMHRDPVAGLYRSIEREKVASTIAPLALPDLTIPVAGMVGPA